MDGWLFDWVTSGIDFILLLQSYRTPFFDAFFRAATFLGTEPAYILAIPLFYWLVQPRFGRRLGYVFVLAVFWNNFFKNLFGLPRPFQFDDRVIRLVEQDGYGLPSGHAMTVTAVWGYVAWRWRKAGGWVIPLAAAGIAAIAFSRLYLGVHFPADVAVGLILGAIVLALGIKYEPALSAWLARSPERLILLAGIALPVALLFLQPGDELGYPAEGGATITGMLLGINIGFFYEARRIRFSAAGSALQLVLRYALGLVLVVACWLGLKILFGFIPGGHLVEIVLRFIRYAVTGCTLAWWAPAAFVRLGLAQRESDVPPSIA